LKAAAKQSRGRRSCFQRSLPNMENGMVRGSSSLKLPVGAAMVWSIGRLARRSKASAIRDNSYTIWSLTADRCKTTARRRQDCKITQVVTATAAKTSAKNRSEERRVGEECRNQRCAQG